MFGLNGDCKIDLKIIDASQTDTSSPVLYLYILLENTKRKSFISDIF